MDYQELKNGIKKLQKIKSLCVKTIGKSVFGNNIYAVECIKHNDFPWVIITAGIHGREHLSCDLVIKQIYDFVKLKNVCYLKKDEIFFKKGTDYDKKYRLCRNFDSGTGRNFKADRGVRELDRDPRGILSLQGKKGKCFHRHVSKRKMRDPGEGHRRIPGVRIGTQSASTGSRKNDCCRYSVSPPCRDR